MGWITGLLSDGARDYNGLEPGIIKGWRDGLLWDGERVFYIQW